MLQCTTYERQMTNFNMQTEFRSTTGASTIGVTGGFVYSGANNVQDVLLDIDRAVQRRQAAVDAAVVSVGTLQGEVDAVESNLSTHSSATTAHGSDGGVVGVNTLNSSLATKLNKSGDTMSGTLNMSGNRIDNIGNPNSEDDAVSRNYADNRYIKIDQIRMVPPVSAILSNLDTPARAEYCTYSSDTWWCKVTAECLPGEIMLSCSGHYNSMCEGSHACDYLGAWPSIEGGIHRCTAEVGMDVDISQTLTVYAICAQ